MDGTLTEVEERMLEEALVEAHEISEVEEETVDENLKHIKENSNSVLVEEITSRFSSAEWFSAIENLRITIGGVGGIGSWTSLLLSRTNVGSISIFDDDGVESSNLSGQFFSKNDVDSPKVTAMARLMRDFSNHYNTYAYNIKYDRRSIPTNVMIGAFDNMKARKDFFYSWLTKVNLTDNSNKKELLFIDARLAAEELQVFCMTGEDSYLIDKYAKNWLFDDSAAEETQCSYKQTSYCANMIASIIVNLVVNYAANLANPIIERDLPFFINYDAERMLLRKEYE